jgi:K+-transporting ATPase ATPase C chain
MLIATVFFGLLYGLAGTGVSQLLFHYQANGSLLKTGDGSQLIGQNWNGYNDTRIIDPEWFHGRPDSDNPLKATGQTGESGGSNLGPRSKVLEEETAKLVAAWHEYDVTPTPDLVTSSGSGLDPDITPDDALVQIPMVAQATQINRATLRKLITDFTGNATVGFLGNKTINVLDLNRGLQKLEKSVTYPRSVHGR